MSCFEGKMQLLGVGPGHRTCGAALQLAADQCVSVAILVPLVPLAKMERRQAVSKRRYIYIIAFSSLFERRMLDRRPGNKQPEAKESKEHGFIRCQAAAIANMHNMLSSLQELW